MSLRLRLAVALAALLPACTRGQEPLAGAPPARSSAEAAAAVVPSSPSSSAAAAPVDSPRLGDPRWQRAAEDDDPAARQALADALGATGLVAALEDGGAIARTALSTLPFADDADLALGPLARRARAQKANAEALGPILLAMLGIAGRPARATEALDPEGAVEAGEVLLSIAVDTALAHEPRALAISAARALAEKRLLDPARIPGDLDPP